MSAKEKAMKYAERKCRDPRVQHYDFVAFRCWQEGYAAGYRAAKREVKHGR